MELPAGLSPEIAAWMQTQIALSNMRTAATLRAEINKVDDWANGLFTVFLNILPSLLKSNPELARQIAPQWKKASEDFDRIHLHGKPAREDEPLEFLEARKMMYRIFGLLGIWKDAEAKKTLQSVPRVRRA